MDAEHADMLREGMEELRTEGRYHGDSDGEDDDDLNPRVQRMQLEEPVSAPPTIASSSASARSASAAMKSKNPFRSDAFTDRS